MAVEPERSDEDVKMKFDPSTFTWQGVSYGVGEGKKSKEILSDISGSLQNGEVCAILGPSGAGKTSLLNVLAGRIQNRGEKQRVNGSMLLDGQSISGAGLRKRIAYVMQQDLLCPTHTPREALLFSAMLRLPRSIPLQTKRAMVESMLSDLGLQKCADTYIGNELLRGISGGEKKRVSVGIELIMQPKLVFLDEPTSGLDSFAAHAVIKKLIDLAKSSGSNVLCTIHQPSSEVFHSFSKAFFIHQGTRFFFGEVSALSTQLHSVGHGCPAEYNLADHTMFIIQTESEQTLTKIKGAMVNDTTDATQSDAPGVDGRKSIAGALEGATSSFFRQVFELTKREAQYVWRDKAGLIASVVVPTILNLFFANIFQNVGDVNEPDYDFMSHFGGISNTAIGGMFGAAQPLLLRFPLDRGLFLREYATSTYGAAAYFISKSMVELPQSLLNSIIVWVCTYWIEGLNGNFFIHVLAFWATGVAAASTALLVGSLAANAEVAQQSAPAIFVPQLLFAGFFIRTTQVPDWLSWVQYICSLKYGMNLYILNEFGESTREGWPLHLQIQAKTMIERNDIDPDHWWVYALVLVLLILFFRLLSILALARRAAAFF